MVLWASSREETQIRKSDGHWVRGVDIKYLEYEASASDASEILDLRKADNCLLATRSGIDEVYSLAADMCIG